MIRDNRTPCDKTKTNACLGLNTEILTEHGWKNYAQVIVGEQAWVADPRTRELHLAEIVGTTLREERELLSVHLSGSQTLSTSDHCWVDNHGEFFQTGDQYSARKLLRIEDLFPADFSQIPNNPLVMLAGVIARWGMLQFDGSERPAVVITVKDEYSSHMVNSLNALIERCFWNTRDMPEIGYRETAREASWTLRGEAALELHDVAHAPFPFTTAMAREFLAGYTFDSLEISQATIREENEVVVDKVQHCAVLAGLRTYIRLQRDTDHFLLKFFSTAKSPEILDVLNVTTAGMGGSVWCPVLDSGFWIARIRSDFHGNTPFVNYVSPAFITGNCYGC